jgi:hypothetical protein
LRQISSFVEHALVEVVADVVVCARVVCGAAGRLAVDEVGLGDADDEPGGRAQRLADVGAEQAGEHLDEVVALPPAVHVALAEPELAVGQQPCPQAVVVYSQAPWLVAANRHSGALEKLKTRVPCIATHRAIEADDLKPVPGFGHRPRSGEGDRVSCEGGAREEGGVAV